MLRTAHGRWIGTDGRTMEADRAAAADTAAAAGRSRATVEEQSRVLRRHSLGAENRGAVAGCAGAVPERSDLLAAAQRMGRSRHMGSRLARAAFELGPEGPAEMGRDLRRWKFRAGEKGGSEVGKTKRGKGTKWMVLVDGEGVPVGALLASASPAEVKLLEPTLETVRLPVPHRRPQRVDPERIIADKAYDSDPLRERLAQRGTDLIVPNRSNRKRKTADGRKLRRYRRRWKVERTFAWFGNFRRLTVRYDRLIVVYRAFFHVACLMITLRHL